MSLHKVSCWNCIGKFCFIQGLSIILSRRMLNIPIFFGWRFFWFNDMCWCSSSELWFGIHVYLLHYFLGSDRFSYIVVVCSAQRNLLVGEIDNLQRCILVWFVTSSCLCFDVWVLILLIFNTKLEQVLERLPNSMTRAYQ